MTKASKEPLISVIVPIYNVEKYLDKCVGSIIDQTYKNLEIILVDDGSPDNSPKMCDEWSKKDKRIKVIHKENGGLSDARNAAIDVAKGEYITFIDSDDYVSYDFIAYLYKNIKSNMISVAPYIITTDSKQINTDMGYKNEELNNKQALDRMITDRGFTVSACSKLYDISLFEGVRYPKGRLFEDTATTYKLFLKCNEISYCSKGGYYYYKREDSIINSAYNKKQLDFIIFTDKMIEDVLKKYPDLSDSIESKKIDARFSILRRMLLTKALSKEDKEEKDKIIKYIKERKKTILKSNYNKKIKIATILLLFGEPIFKFFWKLYSKLKYEI